MAEIAMISLPVNVAGATEICGFGVVSPFAAACLQYPWLSIRLSSFSSCWICWALIFAKVLIINKLISNTEAFIVSEIDSVTKISK